MISQFCDYFGNSLINTDPSAVSVALLVGHDALVDAVVGLAEVLERELAVVDPVALPRQVATVDLKIVVARMTLRATKV